MSNELSALQRAVNSQAIYREARDIADSDHVMSVYAAPEFGELNDDGKEWIIAIIEETKARTLAACAAALPTERLIDPIHKYVDPTPIIYIQYSDDGLHIRKWSFEPFEAGTRYIPAFVPHWDNPDGPGAA